MDDEADTVKTSPKQNSGGGIVINMNDDDGPQQMVREIGVCAAFPLLEEEDLRKTIIIPSDQLKLELQTKRIVKAVHQHRRKRPRNDKAQEDDGDDDSALMDEPRLDQSLEGEYLEGEKGSPRKKVKMGPPRTIPPSSSSSSKKGSEKGLKVGSKQCGKGCPKTKEAVKTTATTDASTVLVNTDILSSSSTGITGIYQSPQTKQASQGDHSVVQSKPQHPSSTATLVTPASRCNDGSKFTESFSSSSLPRFSVVSVKARCIPGNQLNLFPLQMDIDDTSSDEEEDYVYQYDDDDDDVETWVEDYDDVWG